MYIDDLHKSKKHEIHSLIQYSNINVNERKDGFLNEFISNKSSHLHFLIDPHAINYEK